MSTRTAITAREFEKMAFDAPTELVRGELVTMNPPGMMHGVVCKNIAFELETWSRKTNAGYVAVNDTGVLTESEPDTVRGADVLFVRTDRIPAAGIPQGLLQVVPDLCVEVLSPTDRWPEVLSKVSEYLGAGVREVWVVDPQERAVQVFLPEKGPVTVREQSEPSSAAVLPEFRCQVADFFRGV